MNNTSVYFSMKKPHTYQNNINQKKQYIETKEEVFSISKGFCFGEWEVINKDKRSFDAFAVDDLHLFYLDNDDFDLTLSVIYLFYIRKF